MQIEKWDDVKGATGSPEQLPVILNHAGESYAILQLRDTDDTRYERFSSMRELARMGKEPDPGHYEVVYVASLPDTLRDMSQNEILEELFQQFNLDRPADFHGHSLSVSDIVALRQNDVISCHYVDSIGFKELSGFLEPSNYLKNAEMALEDDYGMIDGILNNGKSAATDERASVLEQLRQEPTVKDTPKRPRRTLEKELE